jgi:hypothetical protein
LKFDPDEGCDSRVSKWRGETAGIPRLGFALCLPVQSGYIIDLRMFTFILIKFHWPFPVQFPRFGFALYMPFVRPRGLVILLIP